MPGSTGAKSPMVASLLPVVALLSSDARMPLPRCEIYFAVFISSSSNGLLVSAMKLATAMEDSLLLGPTWQAGFLWKASCEGLNGRVGMAIENGLALPTGRAALHVVPAMAYRVVECALYSLGYCGFGCLGEF